MIHYLQCIETFRLIHPSQVIENGIVDTLFVSDIKHIVNTSFTSYRKVIVKTSFASFTKILVKCPLQAIGWVLVIDRLKVPEKFC